MTHLDAFLTDILANPDDTAPRLILADWLEERGTEPRWAAPLRRRRLVRPQAGRAAAPALQ